MASLRGWFRTAFVLVLMVGIAYANVEKIIFLGPEKLSPERDLSWPPLKRLSPSNSTLRTLLERAFPTKGDLWLALDPLSALKFPLEAPTLGKDSWFLLDELQEGQRYEVRVCWAATQPSSFHLHKYTYSEVFEDLGHLASLLKFEYPDMPSKGDEGLRTQSEGSSERDTADASSTTTPSTEAAHSVLYLKIIAGADYFTTNETLMREVPPVLVDIILDPYLFNVFPKSLVPTAVYIVVLAVIGFFLSGVIWDKLYSVSKTEPSPSSSSQGEVSRTEEKKDL
ncbi:MAG: hypothetical protein M1819_001152 [Sarea resinae]|nr:MAG: hypothetical protein M1819_001152 [Sarea resinae]